MAYNLLKFLHVASVIVWLGSVTTLTMLNARLVRESAAGAGQAMLARQSAFLGRAVVGPAAGLTLVAGVAAAVVGGLDMGALWLTWGFLGLIISMALGMTAIRRTTASLETALVGNPGAVPAEVTTLRGRLTTLNLINLLVLVSVVAAMVFKPAL
jgi:uncharacterized membrane protein